MSSINELIRQFSATGRMRDQIALEAHMCQCRFYTSQVMQTAFLPSGDLQVVSSGSPQPHPLPPPAKRRFAVFRTDPSDTRLDDGPIAMSLGMILSAIDEMPEVDGFLFYDDGNCFVGYTKAAFPRLQRVLANSQSGVEVPPGHAVVVYYPQPRPKWSQTKSGVWIADFGSGVDDRQLFDMVEAALPLDSQASILWVVQHRLLKHLASDAAASARWLKRFQQAQERRHLQPGARDLVILPDDRAASLTLAAQIQGFGVSVHAAAPDGSFFVEVIKPDGAITVGMLGPALMATPT